MSKINRYRLLEKKTFCSFCIDLYKVEDEFLNSLAFALSKGFEIVHLYSDSCNSKQIYLYAKKARELCSMYGALLIIKSRVDIAKLVSADGILLSSDDFDINVARNLDDENFIFASVAQDFSQVNACQDVGFDYVILQSEEKFAASNECGLSGNDINIPMFVYCDSLYEKEDCEKLNIRFAYGKRVL